MPGKGSALKYTVLLSGGKHLGKKLNLAVRSTPKGTFMLSTMTYSTLGDKSNVFCQDIVTSNS